MCSLRICGNFHDWSLLAFSKKIGYENNYKVEGVTSGCLTFNLMCSATKLTGGEQHRLAVLIRRLCRENGLWVRHRLVKLVLNDQLQATKAQWQVYMQCNGGNLNDGQLWTKFLWIPFDTRRQFNWLWWVDICNTDNAPTWTFIFLRYIYCPFKYTYHW